MEYGLKDKVVLITGTNNPRGIGAEIAMAFAKEGAKVAMVYKRLDFPYDGEKTDENSFDSYYKALSEDSSVVEAEMRKITSDYMIIESDITIEANIAHIYDQIENRFGMVNILINNAGMYAENDTIFTITSADIDTTYDVEVKGTIMMTHEFVKRFSKRAEGSSTENETLKQRMDRGYRKGLDTSNIPSDLYGRVINLSTDSAQVFAGQIAYGSSKAAVEALTRSIAMEVGYLGITVNAIAPGPTQTGWIDKELEKSVLPSIPLGRLGQPQDIANAILFLASDKASWITGQVIKVSGGHAL
ncbi:SDR family oxidoreductase [Schnuerera sp. xch1]|uniref:SDR family NAD(P)-dependent oxidoreductase n=1 Tax=Schnuerera sp. xch1 TaxID=2874283 RepID=UPI001CBF9E93|nr:SDR family oxidoreductase [Schnuerera sp. xch1]MBZ2174676.1 SDR family oxidoreductase [Schnuerera sp. xch1]